MGGIGSGKSYWKNRPKKSSKLFTSSLQKLGISELVKQCKQFPGEFIWGKQIRLIVSDEVIHLSSLENVQLLTNCIKVTKMPCNYGGFRYFGLCPCCSKQVRDLFFYESVFACRHCFKMTYYSRHTTLFTRLLVKREKIGKAIHNDEWTKPKWMRKKTFAKLRELYVDLDEKVEIANFYNLRSNRAVDKLFAKYGCAMAAAEAWGGL